MVSQVVNQSRVWWVCVVEQMREMVSNDNMSAAEEREMMRSVAAWAESRAGDAAFAGMVAVDRQQNRPRVVRAD